MNGPALDARARRVACGWYTEAGGGPRVLAAWADDQKRFTDPVEIPSEDPMGRCGVAIRGDGAIVVCWLELVDNVAEVRVCAIDPKTRKAGVVAIVGATAANRAAGVPEIVAATDGTCVVAWRDVSKRQVMTARVGW